MADDEFSELELRLYEYLKSNDFVTKKWSTPTAAASLNVPEEAIYQSLSDLAFKMREKVWIYYRDGGIRVVAE